MATVALIGPDGAGKTAIARRLEARQPLPVKYLYMGVNSGASNVSLPTSRLLHRLRKRGTAPAGCSGNGSGARRMHTARRQRGPLWVFARLLHHLAEEWYRQLACWLFEASGKVVVCDRHLALDYAPEITPVEDGFDRRVRHWIFTHLYPEPDLVVFLDAPGHVLFARKGESTIHELERRRRAYLAMGERLPRFVRIDATLPLDEVYEQVLDHVVGFHGACASTAPLHTLARSGRQQAMRAFMRVRARLADLRARFVCKALDAVLTAQLKGPSRARTELRALLLPGGSRYERLRALSRASHLIAGTAGLARRSLLTSSRLPFRATPELLSFGSGSTVFRLHDGGRSAPRVLKVYRRSLGQRGEALHHLARHFREKYATVLKWYGADLVVPTRFTILHSPLRAYAAVACVQPYIPDAGEDFLARPDEEVLALLRAHAGLRRQFREFATCTLRVIERERRCLDLLGHGNLALIGGGGGSEPAAAPSPQLKVFDFGIFDLAPGTATPAASVRRLIDLVRRIQILDAAAGPPPPTPRALDAEISYSS